MVVCKVDMILLQKQLNIISAYNCRNGLIKKLCMVSLTIASANM